MKLNFKCYYDKLIWFPSSSSILNWGTWSCIDNWCLLVNHASEIYHLVILQLCEHYQVYLDIQKHQGNLLLLVVILMIIISCGFLFCLFFNFVHYQTSLLLHNYSNSRVEEMYLLETFCVPGSFPEYFF